jgi:glycosyltransferase involved in cell wall biosynthesis
MSSITAFIPVFNEEIRINSTIESFLWCDKIILLDKFSSDRTVEIAKSFGSKVFVILVENENSYSSSDWEYLINETKTEWVVRVTASDIFHPELASAVLNKIRNPNFIFDTIYIPFNRYVLGLNNTKSPWFSEVCPMIFRTKTLQINPSSVHHSLLYSENSVTISLDNTKGMFHLTHETCDTMMERHLRYLRAEALDGANETFFDSFKIVLKEIIKVIFWKRTFLLGWDGVMLSFAYVSYYMMGFVYKWELKRGKSSIIYAQLRSEIHKSWLNENKNV